jgi:hypothetical protein
MKPTVTSQHLVGGLKVVLGKKPGAEANGYNGAYCGQAVHVPATPISPGCTTDWSSCVMFQLPTSTLLQWPGPGGPLQGRLLEYTIY